MDPIIAAMILAAVKDAVITIAANSANESPEEYKKKIDALQPSADDLEKWLKKEGDSK